MSVDRSVGHPSPATVEERSAVPLWCVAAVIVSVLAGVTALYWPTVASLRAQWEDMEGLTYAHGYLIVAVGAWLLLRERSRLQAASIGWDWRAAVLVAVLSLTWLIVYRAGIEIAHQLLLPLIGWLSVYAALGWRVARRCAFAFAYLYFAVPVWSLGNELLQYLTVVAVRVLLAVSGFSAYVADNYVHIRSGVFEIAGGCSGLHFFIVALALAALYGKLNRDSLRTRVLLIGMAAALAMLSNWVRVFTIIAAGYLTDMQHSLIREGHYYFGWQVFAVTMVVFFVIARFLPVASQSERQPLEAPQRGRSLSTGLLLAIGVAAVGPIWAAIVSRAAPAERHEVSLPRNVGAWIGDPRSPQDWKPAYAGADIVDAMEYRLADATVDAYVAVYFEQRQGKELLGYGNSVIGETSLRVIAEDRLSVGGSPLNELQVRDASGSDWLIWYYYQVGVDRTTSGLIQQLLYAFKSLITIPVSRVVALRAACAADCSAARARLADLEQAMIPVASAVHLPATAKKGI